MVAFFDYLYYFIYKFYSRKEKGAAASAAMLVGALQAANLLSLLMLPSIFTSAKFYLNKIVFVIVFICFEVVNYIRFIYSNKVSIEQLEKKWEKETEAKKLRNWKLRFIYIGLSIGIFFGLAIYLGSRA